MPVYRGRIEVAADIECSPLPTPSPARGEGDNRVRYLSSGLYIDKNAGETEEFFRNPNLLLPF